MTKKPLLLSIVEVGGYPDFSPLYQRLGYDIRVESSMRKVLKLLKKQQPEVVVAEFNFQSDFRDRTSSLETLIAVLQRFPAIKTVVFYDQVHEVQFARLTERFRFDQAMPFPIDVETLANVIDGFS